MYFNTTFPTGHSEQHMITPKPISWHLFRNLLIVQSEVGVLRVRNILVAVGSRNFQLKCQRGSWTIGVTFYHDLGHIADPRHHLFPPRPLLHLPSHLASGSGLEPGGRDCSGPCWQLESLAVPKDIAPEDWIALLSCHLVYQAPTVGLRCSRQLRMQEAGHVGGSQESPVGT